MFAFAEASPTFYAFVLVAVAVILFFSFTRSTKQAYTSDPRKPPTIPAIIPVPVIGHVLGLLVWRNAYYTMIRYVGN
jgi:hypothetical protein